MGGHWRRFGVPHWRDDVRERREACLLWFLDRNHDLIGSSVLPGGTEAISLPLQSIAHTLVSLNAAYLFMAHNHPSEILQPSVQDIAATRRIWRTARAVGSSLQDHYIFGRSGCFSFRDNGLL
jgi:DNA repair protein RadC